MVELFSNADDRSHRLIHLSADACVHCGECVRVCRDVECADAIEMFPADTIEMFHVDTATRQGRFMPWEGNIRQPWSTTTSGTDLQQCGYTATPCYPRGTGGLPLIDTTCTSCGGCVQACPTTALHYRSVTGLHHDPDASTGRFSDTVCGYCAVGCRLKVRTRDNRITDVVGDGSGVNAGHLCAKGRFAVNYHTSRDRIRQPRIRKRGHFEDVGWHDAMAFAVQRLQQVIQKYGPDAVAVIGGPDATLEECYALHRFARGVLGTNHIDAIADDTLVSRPGMLPLGDFDDVRGDACIVLVGCDPDNTAGVLAAKIRSAVRAGATLAVIDPRRTGLAGRCNRFTADWDCSWLCNFADAHDHPAEWDGLAGRADVHVPVRPGANVPLFEALGRLLNDNTSTITCTDVPDDSSVRRLAHLLRRARRIVLIAGHGLTTVDDTAVAWPMLERILAQYARSRGMRVNTLVIPDRSNAVGAMVAGLRSDLLPGAVSIRNRRMRSVLRDLWGTLPAGTAGSWPRDSCDACKGTHPRDEPTYSKAVTPPGTAGSWPRGSCDACKGTQPREEPSYSKAVTPPASSRVVGDRFSDIVARGADSQVRAVYVFGCDPLHTMPDTLQVKRFFDSLEFVVVHDMFVTPTARFANLLLPGRCRLEKSGTSVNATGLAQHFEPVLDAPENVPDDIQVLAMLAEHMGRPFDNTDLSGIRNQMAAVSPMWKHLPTLGPDTTAIKLPRIPAKPVHSAATSCTPDMVRCHRQYSHTPAEGREPEYPIQLIFVQNYAHHGNGVLTRRTNAMRLSNVPVMTVHPDDAERAELSDGSMALVTSAHGSIVIRLLYSQDVPPAVATIDMHFTELPVHILSGPVPGVIPVDSTADDRTGVCSGGIWTAVRLSQVPDWMPREGTFDMQEARKVRRQ